MTEPADLCAGYQPDNTPHMYAEVPLADSRQEATRGTHTTTLEGAVMPNTTATVTQPADSSTQIVATVQDFDGTNINIELAAFAHTEGADADVYMVNSRRNSADGFNGNQAIALGLALIEAGRRALAFEFDNR